MLQVTPALTHLMLVKVVMPTTSVMEELDPIDNSILYRITKISHMEMEANRGTDKTSPESTNEEF